MLPHPSLRLAGLFLVLAPAVAGQTGAPDRDQSRYWQLPGEVMLPGRTTLRTEVVNLSQPGRVFLNADGHVQPISWPSSSRAMLWIAVDGVPATNTSVVDWWRAVAPRPHSINCVGVLDLPAGQHAITLEADAQRSSVRLAATNLCVFVNPAQHVVRAQSSADSPNIVTQFPSRPGASRCNWSGIPYTNLLEVELPTADLPAMVFASANIELAQNAGDAMIGLSQEQVTDLNESSLQFETSYAVQDLFPSSELDAAVFVQGIFHGTVPSQEYRPRVSMMATEFPPSNHANQLLAFQVSAGANLVALAGGMDVAGSAGSAAQFNCLAQCIGGSAAGCPPLVVGTVVSRGTITIPQGHDGIVFIAGKARCQGDPGDEAADVELQIRVNGTQLGSLGRQGIAGWLGGWDSAQSQRTLAASYLATGAAALPPGDHTVELRARVIPTARPARTQRMSVWDDDPFLVWF